MTLIRAISLPACCLLMSLIFVTSQDDFKMSSPNTDGWINPDVAFEPSRPLPRNNAHKDIDECHKKIDEWSQKYSECEIAVKAMESNRGREKDKEIAAVSNPSEFCTQEKIGANAYLQRFIYLLLEASNLNGVEVQPQNNAHLKFSILSEDLHTLRKFVSEGDVKSIPLRKLDEILGSVLVKPYFSIPEFDFGAVVHNLPSFHIGSFFISVSLPIVWFLTILLTTRNIRKSFLWLFPVAFLTSFLTTATQMFEEAQIKQYETMKKFSHVPSSCETKFSLVEMVFGKSSECSKFLKAHHMDPNLGITSFKVLTTMFGETMATIMEHFGSGTFNFLQSFEEMGFVNRLWGVPVASGLLIAFGILLFLATTGGTGRLPFFLGSFSFHSTAKPDMPHQSNTGGLTSAPRTAEALPSSGNITVNINGQVPPNVHELLASLSHSVLPSDQRSIVALQDPLASGDVHSNLNYSHLHRPNAGFSSKKTHRQFSQLSSKYKSGAKSSSKLIIKRARNLSL